ncbi:MAG: 2-amino-4-hydroxy-6-hydroxymethyldihydropteridine diphosphokinase [Anaerolineae bacterium]|nr:2-amino-4-hydroxy-6-hydroxymethyldihydropteridine diphosphokinase [Anaerolineae bacterium]
MRHAVNYRTITKQVVDLAQESSLYLVERLAEEIACIYLAQSRARSATVHVAKPGAVRFTGCVGVEIHRERVCPPDYRWSYLLLGSNVDPIRNLQQAVEELAKQVNLVDLSPPYETAPIGPTNQLAFPNAACRVETVLDEITLKNQVLRPIEQRLGRVRTADPNGPRAINLGLALVGQGSISAPVGRLVDTDIFATAHVVVPLPIWRRLWCLRVGRPAYTTLPHIPSGPHRRTSATRYPLVTQHLADC